MKKKIHIKIPHYTKLENRMKLMEIEHDKIKNEDVNYDIKIMKKFDKEELTDEIKNKYILNNLLEWNRRLIISNQEKTGYKRHLTNGEISLIIKSINIWKDIIDENNEFCLIVEDDVHFVDNFTEKYLNSLNKVPEDWDILYVNLEYLKEEDKNRKEFSTRKEKILFNNRLKIIKSVKDKVNENKIINKEKSNEYFTLITKGSKWFMGSGYVIKKNTAKLFYENVIKNKCALPIDQEIGYLIEKFNLNSYWLNFNLVKHNFIIDSALSHERYLARKGKSN